MPTDFDFHLIRGWSIVFFMALAVATVLGYRWRRYWLGFMAIFSGVVTLSLLIACAMTWRVSWSASLACDIGSTNINLGVGSSHGTLCFGLAIARGWPPLMWPGRIVVLRYPGRGPYSAQRKGPTSYIPFLEDPIGLQIGHMHRQEAGTPRVNDDYEIVMPNWLFALLFCPWFPLAWYLRRRRQRRNIRDGLCLTCGFDLRAHAPGSKCPECGTLVPARPAASPADSTVASPTPAATPTPHAPSAHPPT